MEFAARYMANGLFLRRCCRRYLGTRFAVPDRRQFHFPLRVDAAPRHLFLRGREKGGLCVPHSPALSGECDGRGG